jgi:hypothetical protein
MVRERPYLVQRTLVLRKTLAWLLVFSVVAAAAPLEANGAPPVPFEEALRSRAGQLPPVRAITHGPKYHWFGYYDKFQFDPTDRYVLAMEVDFEHRSPRPEDTIKIGMVDLEDGDRWIELGESRACGTTAKAISLSVACWT